MTSEEIQAIFFVECEESLAAAEAGLAACEAGTHDADTVNAIFRSVHSIKGGAGAFGFMALQNYTHTFETLLSDVRDGIVPLDGCLIALMLRALDTLSDHVTAARDVDQAPEDTAMLEELAAARGRDEPAAAVAMPAETPAAAPSPDLEGAGAGADFDLDTLLDDIAGSLAEAAPEAAVETWTLWVRPHAGAMQNGGEPLSMLRELVALGGTCVDCDMSEIPALEQLDPAQGYLGWCFAMPADVSVEMVADIFDFVGDECPISYGEGATLPPSRVAPLPAIAEKSSADRSGTGECPGAADAATPGSTGAPAPATAAAAAPRVSGSGTPPRDKTPPTAPAPAGQSIRIDIAKLDRLIDAVGELVIAQAMIAQRLSGEDIAAGEELALLEALTRDIQESAMSIRAQPIGSVFSRVPRLLRELSVSTGKQVNLAVFGEGTELDKTVIERLSEPLTHLIRNAVDHGIEETHVRLAAGKPAEGTLTLSAEQRSGRILISVGDDGGGISRARVLAKAVDKGIVAPEACLSHEEIDALIFAPGFSTAANVSSISGRGVGMDVVRQNVKDLGGRITIESQEGKGTTFTLTLPLTLAISDGMIVNVGGETLVVPLANIVESLRPAPGDVREMGSIGRMLNVRGRFIPVLPVHEAIGAQGAQCLPENGVLIVVDTELAGQTALLVDNIQDQRQVVIKSLDAHYHQVDGVAGATILGDGRVALILDVDGLIANTIRTTERLAA